MKNIEMTYSLSPMQQGMLFHTIYAEHKSGAYVEQFTLTLHCDLNVEAFKQAWQQVVERYAVLRTTFHWQDTGEPVQKVHKQARLPWVQLDWREKPEEQQHRELNTFRQADFSQGFQLNLAPLMRCSLIQTANNTYQFVWTHHHLILDGCSLTIILNEIFTFYEALRHKQTIYLKQVTPYYNYISWLQLQNIDKARAFWQEQLKEFTTPTPIQINKLTTHRLASQENDYTEQKIQLSATTTKSLQTFAQQNQLTLNSLIQSAWALLLSRYNGKNDIIFGATIWQRPSQLSGAETMVGLLINTVPVRIQFSANDFLIPSLQKWQAQLLELEQYSYTPLLDIQKWNVIPSDTPLFDSIVFFDNYPINSRLTEINSVLKIDQVRHRGRTDYPLTILVSPESELLLRFMYDCNCFDPRTIKQIMEHLKTLLEGMLNNPLQRLYELPILTETEQQQFKAWNNTAVDYPTDVCLHQLFEAQVKCSHNSIAAVFKDQQLSYAVLNDKANQLSHHLQNLGVKTEVIVGIFIERSMEMLIGLLAILKTGGAYLPLDPALPAPRIAAILEDAQVKVILTTSNLTSKLPKTITHVCLDTDKERLSTLSTTNPGCNVAPHNLAYVIYTSGSSGQPKGVMISHHAITNHTFWMQANFPLDKTDKVLQKTPFSFDASVWEFYAPLIAGSQLIIAEPNGHQDPAYLITTIIEQKITIRIGSYSSSPLLQHRTYGSVYGA